MSMKKKHIKGEFLRKNRDLSDDISINDVRIGDIYWVNYPYEEDEVLDQNGHSTKGKIRPSLVIGKRNDRIIVVKGTTSENKNYIDDDDIETVDGIRIDCARVSRLKEHDLLEKEGHINTSDPNFKKITNKLKKNIKDENKTVWVRTWEQVNMNLLNKPIDDLCVMSINEDVFTDDNIKIYDFDKWVDGKINTLLIFGYSGAGKTFLSKAIQKEYKCPVIHLDELKNEFAQKFPNMKELSKKNKPIFLTKVIEYGENKYPNKRIVIEGVQIAFCGPAILENRACIILGTSILKSAYRAQKREIELGDEGHDRLKRQFPDDPDWKITLRRITQFPNRFYVNYKRVKPYFDIFQKDAKFQDAEDGIFTEDSKMNKRYIAPKVKNFREFCEKIKNPEEALEWFIQNKVKWTKNGNDNPFQWPDDLIRDKMGNCFDQTLFMHYFCRSKRIDNKMFLITWLGDNNKATGHAVPVYKKGSYCFVWLYLKPGAGMIGGPFRNYNEVKDVLDRYFTISVNKIIKTPTTSISSYLDDDDLAIFDEYYGRRDLTQAEYIQMGFGKNMRSSHLYKIWLYKGRFQLPNPALYMYDILSGVGKLFKGEELD